MKPELMRFVLLDGPFVAWRALEIHSEWANRWVMPIHLSSTKTPAVSVPKE